MSAMRQAPVIDFEKYRLANGLQVILHSDPKLPVAHVNLWYHVGSKNEQPGRTGMAHLFEHMMFQGSKNADGEYLTYLETAGANMREGGVNGTTSFDRTNYFETVPSEALEYVLWLESDRMGFLAEALTQEKLDNQRGVVKNERRQSYENVPYGRALQLIFENLFPRGHPYSWIVIGSQEDLDAASLQETKDFFHKHYAPNNCSLVIAGDFDAAQARRWVEKYFGPLPPGPPLERPRLWVPRLEGERRVTVSDRVPLERLYLVWPAPAYFHAGDAELDLASRILSRGKNSRLYRRLVYQEQVASDVSAFNYSLEISGLFGVVATARPGQSLGGLDDLIREEIAAFAEEGPSPEELEREKAKQEFKFVSGLERIGGFGGKADLLNQYNTFLGEPGYFQEDYLRYQQLGAEEVRKAVAACLKPSHRVALSFVPEPSARPQGVEPNREHRPGIGSPKSFRPPALAAETIAPGLTVAVAERHDLPKVAVSLLLKSGSSSDPMSRPGVAWMTTAMLDEGTGSRTTLEIQGELDRIGASFGSGAESENCHLALEVLKVHLEPAVRLLADLILNSTFPPEELERQRKLRLDRILQERNSPSATAGRVFRSLLFAEGHPLGLPTGGNEASVQVLTRRELVEFHRVHWRPDNAVLLFAGDITLAEAARLAGDCLGGWEAGAVPQVALPAASPPEGIRVALVDRQDAPQSQIRIGSIGPARKVADYHAIELMNAVLGGSFSSRLNLNLREDKGYTYGVSTRFAYARQGGFWVGGTAVQTSVTTQTLLELHKEIAAIGEARPITQAELSAAQQNLVRGFAQRFETVGRVADQMSELFAYDLPLETLAGYPAAIDSVPLEQVRAAARRYLDETRLLVVVVGDLKQLEDPVRQLDLGPVEIVDPGGKPVCS